MTRFVPPSGSISNGSLTSMTALQVADRPYSVSFGGGDDGLVHEVGCGLRSSGLHGADTTAAGEALPLVP